MPEFESECKEEIWASLYAVNENKRFVLEFENSEMAEDIVKKDEKGDEKERKHMRNIQHNFKNH